MQKEREKFCLITVRIYKLYQEAPFYMKSMRLINNREVLTDQLLNYIKSHKSCLELSAIELFNQFSHDTRTIITDLQTANWLLTHIQDIKNMNPIMLEELQNLKK